MAITPADRQFLSKIVQDAIEEDFIRAPDRGRYNDELRIGGCSPCICCCPSGGGKDGEAAVVIAIALFAISFFVGFFYTARSSRSAVQAQSDLSKAYQASDLTAQVHAIPAPTFYSVPPPVGYDYAQRPIYDAMASAPPVVVEYAPQQYPPFAPQVPGGYGQPYSNQPAYYVQGYAPPVARQALYVPQPAYYEAPRSLRHDVYQNAVILLEGRRNERVLAASAQGIMTIGAGLLTVALLISLIAEPEIATVGMGLTGAGVGFAGLMMWLGKHACLINEREQEAAENILQALRA